MPQQHNLSSKLRKAMQEASTLLLLLVALMLLLALFSFNPDDPGWNGATLKSPTNLMGLSGSWLADLLFSLAGLAAWLFPLVLIYLSVQLLRRPWEKEDWDPFIPSLRFLGLVLLLMGVAAIAAGHPVASSLPYGAGGILGQSLASITNPLLGQLGASLMFISCVITGLSLITGWSWLVIMDEIGNFLVKLTLNWLPNIKEALPSLPLIETQTTPLTTTREEPRFDQLNPADLDENDLDENELDESEEDESEEEKLPRLTTLDILQPEPDKQAHQ